MTLPVQFIDLMGALSQAMDLISQAVSNHHYRVGFFAASIARALGLPNQLQLDLLVAGLVHDAGAFSLKSRLDALQFEADNVIHAEAGYRLMRSYPRLERVATLVRHHHTSNQDLLRLDAPRESNILNLADRADVLLRGGVNIGQLAANCVAKLSVMPEERFHQPYLQAFLDIAASGEFWEQAAEPQEHLRELVPESLENNLLSLDEILDFSHLFSQIIDFRSRFTATHSRGVAETSMSLARLVGFDSLDLQRIHVAGNLHDLGKLAVSGEILEKPGPLTDGEYALMKEHAGHSHRILSAVPGLERISDWASMHHERLDGKGYPFGRGADELSMGSRIVAVSDVFTAITEDRPYRKGMLRGEARAVLERMAESALDRGLVALLLDNYEDSCQVRAECQQKAWREFERFYTDHP